MLRISLGMYVMVSVTVPFLLLTGTAAMASELNQHVERVQKAIPGQESSVTVEKALEQARKLSETMRLPENIHAREGLEAARQSFGQFNSQNFQEKLRCQMERVSPQEQTRTTPENGTFTVQEPIYLFLSSSIPEAVVNRYLIDVSRTGGQRIIPVMFGLPEGKEGKRLDAAYFSRVLRADPGCKDAPASPCKRLDMPLRVNPVLFSRYNITEVPALVYDKGQDSWAVHGDAELVFLLEKLAKAANSPALTGISDRLRGVR